MKKIIAVLKIGFRTFMPNCRDAARLQSEALDTKLSLSKRFGLRLHLLVCKWCRRYGKQLHFLRHAAQEHCEDFTDAAPQKLSAEARDRIKQRLQAEK